MTKIGGFFFSSFHVVVFFNDEDDDGPFELWSLAPLLDFRKAITFSRRSLSRSSEAVRAADRV